MEQTINNNDSMEAVLSLLRESTAMAWRLAKAEIKKALRNLFREVTKIICAAWKGIKATPRMIVEALDWTLHFLVYHPWVVVAMLVCVIAWQGLRIMQDAVERNNDSLKIYQLEEQNDRLQMKYYRLTK